MPIDGTQAAELAAKMNQRSGPRVKPLRRLAPNTRDMTVSVIVQRMEALTTQLLRPTGDAALKKATWGILNLPAAIQGDTTVAAAAQSRRKKAPQRDQSDPLWGSKVDKLKEEPHLHAAWKAIKDGDLKKASRNLEGLTPRARLTAETVMLAASKHPVDKKPPVGLDLSPEDLAKAPDFSPRLVKSVVMGTPNGKAAGTSGWTWELLKAVCAYPAGRAALTKLVNALVAGRTRPLAALVTCSLTLLAKEGGGVRPVAVEEPLISLVSKCLARVLSSKMKPVFEGVQFAGGLRRGVEAAALAVKDALAARDDVVLRSLDISNAFNEGYRHPMMQAIRRTMPEALPWMAFLYNQPSALVLGGIRALESQSGQRQGDAMSMMAFCTTLQPAIVNAAKGLDVRVIAYADDVRVIGTPAATRVYEQRFAAEAAKIGLSCNASKTETYDPGSDAGTMVFGVPVGTVQYVAEATKAFIEKWELKVHRCVQLADMGFPHEADQLLRRSLRPQLDSFIRVTEVSTPTLGKLNKMLLRAVRRITGIKVSWGEIQAKYKSGGLSFPPVRNQSRAAAQAAFRELKDFGFPVSERNVQERFIRRVARDPELKLGQEPDTAFEAGPVPDGTRVSPFMALPQWMTSCEESMEKDDFLSAVALQLGRDSLPKGTKARTFASTKNLQRAWVSWSIHTPFPDSLDPAVVKASLKGVYPVARTFLSFALAKDMANLMRTWKQQRRGQQKGSIRLLHED